MTRVEYMNCMANKLKRLPKEDFDQAMEYFQEYFEEAGVENEQQAIEDLGAPEMAADNIIMNLAVKNAKEPKQGVKKGLSAIWIGILALFAAPIGFPLALAGAAVAIAIILSIAALLLSVFLAAAACLVASIVGGIGSIHFLFSSPINGMTTLGGSLLMLGISIFLLIGCEKLFRLFVTGGTKLFGKAVKGGRRNEN